MKFLGNHKENFNCEKSKELENLRKKVRELEMQLKDLKREKTAERENWENEKKGFESVGYMVRFRKFKDLRRMVRRRRGSIEGLQKFHRIG